MTSAAAPPEIRYVAASDGVHVAYRVEGSDGACIGGRGAGVFIDPAPGRRLGDPNSMIEASRS
jgi:hypothetical protein